MLDMGMKMKMVFFESVWNQKIKCGFRLRAQFKRSM